MVRRPSEGRDGASRCSGSTEQRVDLPCPGQKRGLKRESIKSNPKGRQPLYNKRIGKKGEEGQTLTGCTDAVVLFAQEAAEEIIRCFHNMPWREVHPAHGR